MDPKDLKFIKMIDDRITLKQREYMQSTGFTQRKITDTPTDNLSVVNRKYANLSGTVANRPTSSVATVGQRYFATDTKIPMTFDGANWYNGIGSVVASG